MSFRPADTIYIHMTDFFAGISCLLVLVVGIVYVGSEQKVKAASEVRCAATPSFAEIVGQLAQHVNDGFAKKGNSAQVTVEERKKASMPTGRSYVMALPNDWNFAIGEAKLDTLQKDRVKDACHMALSSMRESVGDANFRVEVNGHVSNEWESLTKDKVANYLDLDAAEVIVYDSFFDANGQLKGAGGAFTKDIRDGFLQSVNNGLSDKRARYGIKLCRSVFAQANASDWSQFFIENIQAANQYTRHNDQAGKADDHRRITFTFYEVPEGCKV